jgi:hypothetical protein
VTILHEIHTWSKGLATWQQDAIARIYANRELTEADLDDLYALAKTAVGIEDAQKRVAKALDAAQIATPTDPTRLVQLLAIKELSNVNALASGGSLPIAESGLTVIYGENGAGKSGYCANPQARMPRPASYQREAILPDAKIDPAKAGKPSAKFEVAVDGAKSDLARTFGKPAPEALSEIAIFDTHCARAEHRQPWRLCLSPLRVGHP